jgi:hypothetical protein
MNVRTEQVGWLSVALLKAFHLCAQPAGTDLTGEELQQIVKGKTWAIAFYGDLSDALRTAYWDFKADGSVCARLANNKPGTRCADTGTWKIQGNMLC